MAGLAARRYLIATLLAGRTPACTTVARPSLAKKASGPAFRKCRAKFSNSCRPSTSLRLPLVFAQWWLQQRLVKCYCNLPCGPASHCGPHQTHQRQPGSVVGKGGSASWAVSCSTYCLQHRSSSASLQIWALRAVLQLGGSAAWEKRMPPATLTQIKNCDLHVQHCTDDTALLSERAGQSAGCTGRSACSLQSLGLQWCQNHPHPLS